MSEDRTAPPQQEADGPAVERPDLELLRLEYETVLSEKEGQLKTRNATTILALTVGIGVLGYAIENGGDNLLFLLFPLLVFVSLYTNYVYRRLLALKADAYIRVFIEPHLKELRWHARKSGYSIGLIYHLQYILVAAVFIAVILINLYYVSARLSPEVSALITAVAASTVILVTWDNVRDPYARLIEKWEERKAAESERSVPVLDTERSTGSA